MTGGQVIEVANFTVFTVLMWPCIYWPRVGGFLQDATSLVWMWFCDVT